MTDAEFNVRHSIFTGIVQQWHRKDEQEFAFILEDSVLKALFDPATRWAVVQYMTELENTNTIQS